MALELPPAPPAWVDQLGQLLRERDFAAEPEPQPEPQTDAPLLGRAQDWLDRHARPALTQFDAALSRAGVGLAAQWDRMSGGPGLTASVTQNGKVLARYWLELKAENGVLRASATLACGGDRPAPASNGTRIAGKVKLDALGADDLAADLTAALGRCLR